MFTFRRSLFPSRNELFAPSSGLYPPYFADMVIPVPGADGGINRKAYEANEAGLFAVIDPYPDMAIGDLLEVILNDKKVGELKVKDEDLDRRWFFFVRTDGLVPGRLFTCHYVLTRAGETKPDDPSATLTLLLEVDDPAGDDEEPFEPWHSALPIVGLPQDVIENGVTKPWLDSGVPLIITRYPNIAEGDIILVKWGSVFLPPHILTQAEVDGTVEIIVMARPEDILTAGDSAALIIHYNICDLVYNWSVKWSKSTSVQVDAGVSRLNALIIKEADDGKIILADLDANPVTLQVLIKAGDVYAAGDTLKFTVIGTPIPDRPPRTFTVEAIVRTPPYIHEIPVEYAFVKLFAQGTLDASYALRKQDGSPTLYSRRTFATVIGNPSLLPAPAISEVVGNILPALIQAASVVIRYPAINNGDFLTVIWLGKKSNGDDYLHEEEHTVSGEEQKAGEVTIYVMGEHVKVLENGSLKLQYRVFNDDPGQYGTSESEFLRVNVGSWQATHPAPKVEEAPDDIIDPSQTDKLVHVRVLPVNWVKGDTLTFRWIGINLYGSTSGCVPITLATVGQPVRFRVDKQYVSANIGYYVKVIYTLLHAATGKYSYSDPLEVLVGIPLGKLPPPTVAQAPGGTLNPMHAINGVDIDCSYPSMDALLDILGLKWRGSPGAGTSEDVEKPAEATGTVRFHLPPSFVGANINREVAVNYDVQRYGLWTPSEILPLKVLNFPNPETELPRPEVPEAAAGELLVMELAGNAKVLVKAWPFIALKQLIWLYIEGQASTGDYRIDLLTAREVNSTQLTQGLNETLLKTELLKLLHGSNATVVCKVIFDNSTDEDAAIVFPKLPLVIRQHYEYVTPVITTVKTPSGTVIPEAGQTYDKRLTIEGTATRAEKVDVQINGVPKGMPKVDASSEWTLTVDLIEGLHRVEAIAQYDADDKVSDPRTFTIAVATKPSITAVTDASGPVDDNDTTYFTEVTVSVHADSHQTVQLYDGITAIGNPILLDASGAGSIKLSSLSLKTYTLKAKATYGDQLESAVRIFKVATASAPTIKSITDALGEVPPNDITFYNSVTIIGTAVANQRVQIYDGATPIAPDTLIDNKGEWTKTLNGLSATAHNIKVKALYGPQPESAVRAFTVAVASAPTIKSITDSLGEVPPNGITFDTSVTITGTAVANQRVQIYDGITPIAPDTPVDNKGEWTKTLTGLTATAHNIKVKALYGPQPESAVRAFTVAVASAPTIKSITDSKGEVLHNGTTFDNSVTITGTAVANQRVQIYDGVTPIAPDTPVDNKGEWTKTLTGLTATAHNIKVKALYGPQPESAVRAFTVAVASAPTIKSITDSLGEVPPNGITFDTSVTITGTAVANQRVQIYDGITPIAPDTPVDNKGEWTKTLTGLTATAHNIKVKASYGTQPESAVRAFTVAVSSTPRIVSVTDAKGSIGNNGTTYENEVTVTVSADSNQRVQLYNGAAPIGSPITLGSNGSASTRLSSLSQSTYVLKAKALYGNQLESPAHSFTVRAHLTTTLTSVRHSGGELGNGGKTTDTSVTVTGAATPLYSVQIFLNNVGGQTVSVNGSGVWSLTLGIHLGSNTVYARSVVNNQQTVSRSFTRESPLAPLHFNESPVTLGGKTYIIPGNPNVLPEFNSGNSVQHRASGGRPGYTYTSSNPRVAEVDSSSGLVTVRGRGTTTITARDAANQSKSYNVTVTNVIQCFGFGNATWTQANSSVAAAGARIPSLAELHEMHLAYGARWPMSTHHYWSTDHSNFWFPFPAKKAKYITSGAVVDIRTSGHYSDVVGIR